MKAIRKSDGKVIEVREWCGASDVVYSDLDMNRFYQASELDFNVEEAEEVTIDGWVAINAFVARDTVDGELNIFTEIPITCNRDSLQAYWVGENGSLLLPKKCEKMFESLDSKTIQEVTITIKPKKQ